MTVILDLIPTTGTHNASAEVIHKSLNESSSCLNATSSTLLQDDEESSPITPDDELEIPKFEFRPRTRRRLPVHASP
ncbi:hypothetical protein E4T56_gene11807 [Termitomyces sp. T112]|nr:hypothetical protein E4T56_gene11807 [Termitomyces sp. T112]KAH0580661.1 hypothetical protein H2248_002151 [Termitomyces sp. 'cryptogamus']